MNKSTVMIDTPETCGDCPFCIYTAEEKRFIGYTHTLDEDYYCKVLDRFMAYDKVDGGLDILGKPIDCPLDQPTVTKLDEKRNMTGEEIIALLEKTYADFCECKGGESWFEIDGKEYYTDTGYAIEGLHFFMEVFKQRLAEEAESEVEGGGVIYYPQVEGVTPTVVSEGKQEPCGDYISRQAAIETIFEQGSAEKLEIDFAKLLLLQRAIKAMPSVNPQPKIGHWITEIKSDLRGDMWPTNPKCSKCGEEPYYSNTIYDYKFCPYCGAKMVEPQERSDKG